MAEQSEHDIASDALGRRNSGPLDEWKRSELIRMGFTGYQAEVLLNVPGLYAGSVRETYISKGCSPELAWRILRPYECPEDTN